MKRLQTFAIHLIPVDKIIRHLYTKDRFWRKPALGTGWQYFMVSVQTETLFVYYDSEVDSGYSVDNLVPCTPEGLSGEQLYVPAGLDLNGEENEEADLGLYKIYRGVEIMISIEQMEPIRYLQEVKLSVLSSNRFNINSGEELRV